MFIQGQPALQMARAFTGAKSIASKSGVDCPSCEKELLFTEPNVIHHDPRRKRVLCKGCGHKGFYEL